MKALMLKMSVVALSVMTMVGCASNAANDGPSDDELINAVATGVADALKSGDIDAMVSFFSDDFASGDGGDKASTKEFLSGVKAAGYLDDLEVDLANVKVTIDGEKAECGPVDLEGAFGAISLDFELEKREGNWIVVYMTQY